MVSCGGVRHVGFGEGGATRAQAGLVQQVGRYAGQSLGADGGLAAPAFCVQRAGLGRSALVGIATERAPRGQKCMHASKCSQVVVSCSTWQLTSALPVMQLPARDTACRLFHDAARHLELGRRPSQPARPG